MATLESSGRGTVQSKRPDPCTNKDDCIKAAPNENEMLTQKRSDTIGDPDDCNHRRLLTVQEAAEYLGVADGTAYDLINEGELGSHRFGPCIRISPEMPEEFMERSRNGYSNSVHPTEESFCGPAANPSSTSKRLDARAIANAKVPSGGRGQRRWTCGVSKTGTVVRAYSPSSRSRPPLGTFTVHHTVKP